MLTKPHLYTIVLFVFLFQTHSYSQKKPMEYLGTWGGDIHIINKKKNSTDTISVVFRIHSLDATAKKVLMTIDARKSGIQSSDSVYIKKEYDGYLKGDSLNLSFDVPELDLNFTLDLKLIPKPDNAVLMTSLREGTNKNGENITIIAVKIDNNIADHVKPEGADFKIINHPLDIILMKSKQ